MHRKYPLWVSHGLYVRLVLRIKLPILAPPVLTLFELWPCKSIWSNSEGFVFSENGNRLLTHGCEGLFDASK